MPYTYILECSDGSYYVGSTWNLEQRLWLHNDGAGAEYTKRRLPVQLVWFVETERVDDAYVMEKRIQGWSHEKRQLLIKGGFDAVKGWSKRNRR